MAHVTVGNELTLDRTLFSQDHGVGQRTSPWPRLSFGLGLVGGDLRQLLKADRLLITERSRLLSDRQQPRAGRPR